MPHRTLRHVILAAVLTACGTPAQAPPMPDLAAPPPDLTVLPDLVLVPDLTPARCDDSVQNGDESDTDCGAACVPCAAGRRCRTAADCASRVCTAGACRAPSCADGVQNGDESDADCGGATCPRCGAGRKCADATDCGSGVCQQGACRDATCSDGVKNGNETDVDCGGTCARCADTRACLAGADCQSGVCAQSRCAAPACTDGVKNGGESDADCGGPCAACNVGRVCTIGGDCATKICQTGTCRCGGVLQIQNPNTTALTDYQVRADIAKIITACGPSLRVTDDIGAQVRFCFETSIGECGVDPFASTALWFRVPQLPAQGTTRLFIVQDTQNNATAGGNVFDFYEDWNASSIDPNRWSLVTTTCTPYLEGGALRPGAPAGNNSNCGATTKTYTAPPGSRVVTRLRVGASSDLTIDSDPAVATVFPGWELRTNPFDTFAGWYSDDEVPSQTTMVYGATNTFSNSAIRGQTFLVDLQLGTNQQSRACQSVDGKCSPYQSWQPTYANLYIGSIAYQGVPWFFDWLYVRKMAAAEPVAQLQ